MMTFERFLQSTEEENPPSDLSPELLSLWYTKVGRWDDAHDIAQDIPTKKGSWIHGLLHAIEGDFGNSGYWYHRAGEPSISREQIDQEWERIVRDSL